MAEPARPAESESSPRRGRRIATILGVLATVASLTVGVISVVPILFPNATSVSSLEIAATVVPSDSFAVPLDELDEFPAGAADGCDDAQREWLESTAEQVALVYRVDLRNVASAGAMVSVDSFRATGDASEPSEKVVLVDCADVTVTAAAKFAQLSTDQGEVAVFKNSVTPDGSSSLPDSPVAYNLAPGEAAQFVLRLTGNADFDGGLTAAVTSGRDRIDVPILLDGVQEFQVGGLLGDHGAYFIVTAGALRCVVPGVRENEPVDTDGCR